MRSSVLIVPDKFKGSITAHEAANAIAKGWSMARPQDYLELLPMSDGGDGFGTVMSSLIGASPRMVRIFDAAHRPCRSRWWWQPGTQTAVIDSAGVVGLAMLPPGRYHPFALDTYGLGRILRAAIELGARRCLVGLGGSATNDAGFGLARSLGWEFLDNSGKPIERWIDLTRLENLRAPLSGIPAIEMIAGVDVQNPLLGPRGATRIFGPQKGLNKRDFPAAERSFRKIALCVKRQYGRDLAVTPGAGAAGGLGFGFLAFLNGRLTPGFDLFAKEAHLNKKLRSADLVLTGEGAIDRSSFMGKGAGCVARLCRKMRVPCFGLAGDMGRGLGRPPFFDRVMALTELTTIKEAKRNPAKWLQTLAKRLASEWPATPVAAAPRLDRCQRTQG